MFSIPNTKYIFNKFNPMCSKSSNTIFVYATKYNHKNYYVHDVRIKHRCTHYNQQGMVYSLSFQDINQVAIAYTQLIEYLKTSKNII